ncbi:MAG TPA: sigma-70 family RNA polymerase sigma factor [Terriglobia bacterium]|nr:sigma-70 family RNA polymerase sigma factor [Terriglobia bacterium]
MTAAHDPSAGSRPALERLCETYWNPVFAFIRRSGYDRDQAQDLTQAFFALLLEKNFLEVADPQRGRFRSFLLTAVKHFLSNERDRAQALKRGGGEIPVSIDLLASEASFDPTGSDTETPEDLFERRWALSLLEHAMSRLRSEFSAGRSGQFDKLVPFLSRDSDGARYEELAAEFGVSAGALRTLVHRMRRRYRDLVRAEIAETVATSDEVDDEIRFLMSVLSS